LKRAGLTDAKRGWITVSEYNYDILEQSWDFPINSHRKAGSAARF